ncbi:MAG TPA: BTAD domain-containing putative transcriptional regulator [Solirubrobacteraceae bacterium]|nr:BTAD domain-containing putative transcriptional regulator [Solirubrobacteraceae bacterium]
MAQALDTGAQPTGAPALGASDRQALAEGLAAAACELVDSRKEPVMLVLDDIDQLADEDSATQFVSALCLQAPAQLHIVLCGRRLPRLGLGSARGRGELLELSAPDLAFTEAETAALLLQRLGADAEALAPRCWSLTAGWVGALQLIVDRLERTEPSAWSATLGELLLRRGPQWRDFAAELVAREPLASRRVLAIATVVPFVDAELIAGLGVTGAQAELDGLEARGLLVAMGGHGLRTLSPVLAEVAREGQPAAEVHELREQAAAWLERAGRLEEAFECAASGSRSGIVGLVRRYGSQLVGRGYGARLVHVLRELGTDGEPELQAILGEALGAVGDWDGAMKVFAAVQRRASGEPLPAATAWRFGALLYMRSDMEAAEQVLSAAHIDGPGTSDDALVSAWLSSVLWGKGEIDRAAATAEIALHQAQAGGEPSARAAAHVAAALVAASRGDRELNERHYRLALSAASQAGDTVQLARIHANLSSRAAEEGDYARTIEEADLAVSSGAGHKLFGALATSNKAEALMRRGELEEARAVLLEAIEMLSELGSLLVCAPYIQLGGLDALRGDLARARVSFERARRIAEQAGDVHALVAAHCGLAEALARDDPAAAREHTAQARELASSLERAHALCTSAFVELAAGDRDHAATLSEQAESEARRTGDRPSLARALELRAAVYQPPDEAQLEAAVELWRELGDPIAAARAELVLATWQGEDERAAQLREELTRRGVRAESGIAELAQGGAEVGPELEIVTLGRFAVLREGQPIPLVAWQSRKARDLLKLLASRRGRAITRDAAAEALWPGEDPRPLSNRLSVALSTLRKVLDPDRAHPPDHFVTADQQSLSLRIEHMSLDVARFMEAAQTGIDIAARRDLAAAEAALREAEALYTGDFLEEDLYEDWPVDCREEARSLAQEVSRLLARAAIRREDDEEGARHLRRLLERDPYDADAWTALLAAQLRLQRYGEARRQHAVYVRRMAELAIAPVPLAQTVDARP